MTVYLKVRVLVPVSFEDSATWAVYTLSLHDALPILTVTASLKETVTATVLPALYEPLAVVEDTPVTVGAVVWISRRLFATSEFAAYAVARVRVASLPAASLMVPSFTESEVVVL